MNSKGKPIPLNDAKMPSVASTSGLGTGGGAGVDGNVGSGWGKINVRVGSNPTANGNIVLSFPSAPPTLTVTTDDHFGTLSVTGQGTTSVTISWTNSKLISGELARIDYEWTVST